MLDKLTRAQREARLAAGKAELRLEHALNNLAHIDALARPIPKRKVSREEIHAQAEQAKLREAFVLFQQFGL